MNARHSLGLVVLSLASAVGCGSDAPDPGAATATPPASTSDTKSDAASVPATSAAATGDGGTGGGKAPVASGDGPAAVDCAGDVKSDAPGLISDFEDGTKGLNPSASWKGGFYVFNDKMSEEATVQTLTLPELNRCSDGSSKFALCSSGAGFLTWGAGIGTDLNSETGSKLPVDLSTYSGVSFWIVRRGTASTPATAKVIIADKNTAPEGGACSDGPPTDGQCDPFVKNAPIKNTWSKVEIKFADLKQGGWGKKVPTGFSKDGIYGFQVQVDKMMDFDICIDHVALTP